MHILFLSHYFPPEVNAPATRTFDHARRWVKEKDIEVTVITNHPNHPNGMLYPGYVNRWLTRELIDGIKVRRVKTLLAANAGFARRLLNYLFFMVAALVSAVRVPKPEVVIATSPQFFCAVAGYLVSKMKGCPFVFELRDLWPESIITVGAMRPNFLLRLMEKLELFLYSRAKMIIALTDAFKVNLIRRRIPATKIQVIKNGVDLSLFSPREPQVHLKNELGAQGKFVVAYVGTVGMAHAVDKIVEMAELLENHKDILFIVVGEGSQKKAVQELVESRRLKNIKILPGVPKDQVLDYYALGDINLVTLKKADLFRTVIPSKVFEIMAMARPILCAVNGECRQIIEQAGCGLFVEPENVGEMAAVVLSLSQEPEDLSIMGENGRKFVEAFFNRNELATRYLDVLRNIA
jgi:glycosyltransferase involved in cell wall biosynthesis